MEFARVPYPPCQNNVINCMSAACCGGGAQGYKYKWPELEGMDAGHAKAVIEGGNPLVTAVVIRDDASRIMDFCCNRVWLWVDRNKRVSKVPVIG